MRDIVTPQQIYPALQALLGLPDHCASFELRVASGQCGVVVTCEHYVALDAPGLKQLESVFSEYELVRKEPVLPFKVHAEDSLEFQAAKAKIIGFDAWMRERTERAHAEFMTRTSRLPA